MNPILEVNLSSLRKNVSVIRSQLDDNTQIMAMIKANGYGGGAIAVAQALEIARVSYLAVARTEEGVELREAGIVLPIMVMIADLDDIKTLVAHRLEPEVYSFFALRKFGEYSQKHQVYLPIHLKLDSGMHRMGFGDTEIIELSRELANYPLLQVASVFSHLAASDNPKHDSFTFKQFLRFEKMYDYLRRPAPRHILNSNGILRFPENQYEMVRPGISLYGVGAKMKELTPVYTLKAKVIQLRDVSPPETVGYSRAGQLTYPSKIATINIGYADGLSRLAGHGQYSFLINGLPAPTVGIICMDLCMVDVTGNPTVLVGDDVIVFGENHPVEQLAEVTQTNVYECFTNISRRVKRVVVDESVD